MSTMISLDGKWMIRGFDGQHGMPQQYVGLESDESTFLEATVPGEVHNELMLHGEIPDVTTARGAQEARWVEECVWVYRRWFEAPQAALEARAVWLNFDGLDHNAIIYLNGREIARHANTYTPCRVNVAGMLTPGRNLLCVELESGLFSVSEKPAARYATGLDHKLHKRVWLRKPQFSFSWDWSPRLLNIGIWRSVHLEWGDSLRLDNAVVYTELSDSLNAGKLHCRLFIENVQENEITVTASVQCQDAGSREVELTLPPGISRHDIVIDVERPKLWWPQGHGERNLYTCTVKLSADGTSIGKVTRRVGFRKIEIDQTPHPEAGRYFILKVNNRAIFAKGANWVPPDIIHFRTSGEDYRRLVEMAVEANFNFLRVWGGALYADHAFMEACDEHGIMVWHDFIFACAKYPADDYDFLENVRSEITFAVRDLAHHPSLILWCGNNEYEWGVWEWKYEQPDGLPDYSLYHHFIPVICKEEDPSRPYWPGSPYSLDHENANAKHTGDQHPWEVSLGWREDDLWAYRGDISRFPNEGGVMGACLPETARDFLPDGECHLHSKSWDFHDNAINFWLQPGIGYRIVRNWIGRIPEEMPFEDYLYYSGIMQAEGLKEYIDNFRRRMFNSAAAVFWMYNDCWPASHSWTIVDYYFRRRMSFHPVRRAFQPVMAIPVLEHEDALIFGVNDSGADWEGTLRYGIAGFSGGLPVDEQAEASISAGSAVVLARIPLHKLDAAGRNAACVFAVLNGKDGLPVAQNRIFSARYKDVQWAQPNITVRRDGEYASFDCDVFAWGVKIATDDDLPLPDDLFDVLPGIGYRIPWPSDRPLPRIIRTGNLTG